MESKEDSIKILEMRIRHQMNRSLEKKLEPENIQFYASSAGMLQKQEFAQGSPTEEQENPQQNIYIDAKGNVQPNIDMDENSDLRQESFGNEKDIADQSGYENRPVDMEYINRISKMPRIIEHMEISETKEAQHAKAKNSYESVRQSLNDEKFFPFRKNGLFDIKG